MYRFTSLKDSIKCNQSNVLRVLSLLFCCYVSALLPKVLVMKGNKLELWIDSLATWNLLTVQSNRWILNFNKDWAKERSRGCPLIKDSPFISENHTQYKENVFAIHVLPYLSHWPLRQSLSNSPLDSVLQLMPMRDYLCDLKVKKNNNKITKE